MSRSDAMAYALPPLPYGPDALEPVIDHETMRLHHGQHHRAHVEALNEVLAPHPAWHGLSIEQLLSRIEELPAGIRAEVRDHGGGHANHQLFWKVIRPGGARTPVGALAREIDRVFGSFDAMRARFEEEGTRHAGSGWVFLVTDPRGAGLGIVVTASGDSVLLPPGGTPALLGNDLWEHAYYLRYRNRRADYLRAWWDVVNWTYIDERLQAIRAGKTERLGGPAR